MARAFVFPGQGSQEVGMGRALAEASAAAREVFEEVDDVLEQNLSKLMWDGPADELTLTENAQPALMAVSMAVARTLEKEGGVEIASAKFVAGHSLGEYSALCAAGALSLADTARLLRVRGAAMQAAVPVGEGAMAALIGVDIAAAEAAIAAARGDAEDAPACAVANDNAPGQVVISGVRAAVEAAAEAAKAAGAKKAVMLPVSAPFHCDLMRPAADEMDRALAGVVINEPRPAIIANVTAEPAAAPDMIRSLLVRQVTGRVRWRESVGYMAEHGVTALVELGAGKVLSGLARRINRDLKASSIGDPDSLEAFLKG